MSFSKWMRLPYIKSWLYNMMTGPDAYQGWRTKEVLGRSVDEHTLVARGVVLTRETVIIGSTPGCTPFMESAAPDSVPKRS